MMRPLSSTRSSSSTRPTAGSFWHAPTGYRGETLAEILGAIEERRVDRGLEVPIQVDAQTRAA